MEGPRTHFLNALDPGAEYLHVSPFSLTMTLQLVPLSGGPLRASRVLKTGPNDGHRTIPPTHTLASPPQISSRDVCVWLFPHLQLVVCLPWGKGPL